MSSVASGPGTSGTSSSTAVSSDPAGVTTSNRRVLTGERRTFSGDFAVLAATFGLTSLGAGEGTGLVVRWERRVATGPRGDFVGELAAMEGDLEGAGEASRRRFGGLGVDMDGDGVGNCFGGGGSLSGVCCCCCCARDDLRYSVLGSGFASVSGGMIFSSE